MLELHVRDEVVDVFVGRACQVLNRAEALVELVEWAVRNAPESVILHCAEKADMAPCEMLVAVPPTPPKAGEDEGGEDVPKASTPSAKALVKALSRTNTDLSRISGMSSPHTGSFPSAQSEDENNRLSLLGLSRAVTQVMNETLTGENIELRADFQVLEELGQGGFATVYAAVHRATQRQVAVKILQTDNEIKESQAAEASQGEHTDTDTSDGDAEAAGEPEDPDARESARKRRLENFEYEIRVLRRLEKDLPLHPNIVRFFGVCVDQSPERLCIVLEKLSGGELLDRIVERERFTEKDAGHLFRGLVRAVAALHKVRILHRDIKPENVLFLDTSFHSNFRLCDMGTACLMDEPDSDPYKDVRIGSPGYTAPEILTFKPGCYSPPCDVFSLGVLLYCVLVGYHPFPEGFMQTVKVITCQYEMGAGWEDISPLAKDLVRRMLVKHPKERITTQEILLHPWVTDVDLDATKEDKVLKLEGHRLVVLRKKFKAAAKAAVWSARLRFDKLIR